MAGEKSKPAAFKLKAAAPDNAQATNERDALWCRMLYNDAHGDCRQVRATKRFASDESGKAGEGAGQDREDERQPGAGGFD